jgi:hypothetical protein
MSKNSSPVPNLPHSWEISTWPEGVYPSNGDPEETRRRAQWLVRANRSQLMAEGALSRVGKSLVILGAGYARFLQRQACRVTEYESNNPTLTAGGAP